MKTIRVCYRRQSSRQQGGMLVGVFIGLVIGVLIAFGVVWFLNKSPLPFQDKAARPEQGEDRPTAEGRDQAPLALPGKPGDKADKPRFEFYKILPGGQEATPGPAEPAPPPPVAISPGEVYYLQAGAFQKTADADNLKAKLALSGLEVRVHDVNVPDKGLMHRVRVGPFPTAEDMNRARTQLAQSGIQATVVKVKEGAGTP